MKPVFVRLVEHRDPRGTLVAIEGDHDIPFAIKRVYFITGASRGARRGCHAHRTNRQVAVAIAGGCRILLDDGRTRTEVLLDSPHEALLVDRMIWHEMYDFSVDCVLLMLSSESFDEADYIRRYEEFLQARA